MHAGKYQENLKDGTMYFSGSSYTTNLYGNSIVVNNNINRVVLGIQVQTQSAGKEK